MPEHHRVLYGPKDVPCFDVDRIGHDDLFAHARCDAEFDFQIDQLAIFLHHPDVLQNVEYGAARFVHVLDLGLGDLQVLDLEMCVEKLFVGPDR